MIIFSGGNYFKCKEKPTNCLGRFYRVGHRWIKSKKKWSNMLVEADIIWYEILTENEAKAQSLI